MSSTFIIIFLWLQNNTEHKSDLMFDGKIKTLVNPGVTENKIHSIALYILVNNLTKIVYLCTLFFTL